MRNLDELIEKYQGTIGESEEIHWAVPVEAFLEAHFELDKSDFECMECTQASSMPVLPFSLNNEDRTVGAKFECLSCGCESTLMTDMSPSSSFNTLVDGLYSELSATGRRY